jgi:hypothetical protein
MFFCQPARKMRTAPQIFKTASQALYSVVWVSLFWVPSYSSFSLRVQESGTSKGAKICCSHICLSAGFRADRQMPVQKMNFCTLIAKPL